MKALLKNYHQAPRKIRLVADLIRGKSVRDARARLLFLDKKASLPMRKLLESAVANARQSGKDAEHLAVWRISVDKGRVAVRSRPFARGRSGKIRKTMSIISIELAAQSQQTENSKQKKEKKA